MHQERRTLEALFFTPASDAELLLGKTLAGLIPGLGATWAGLALYILLVDAIGWSRHRFLPLPNGTWLLAGLVLLPVVALLSVALTVVVSARARTARGAREVVGVIALPAVALLMMQALGVLRLGWAAVLFLSVLLGGGAWLLLILAARTFRRDNAVLYS